MKEEEEIEDSSFISDTELVKNIDEEDIYLISEKELVKKIIQYEYYLFEIPKERLTYSFYLTLIKKDEYYLSEVPESFLSQEMILSVPNSSFSMDVITILEKRLYSGTLSSSKLVQLFDIDFCKKILMYKQSLRLPYYHFYRYGIYTINEMETILFSVMKYVTHNNIIKLFKNVPKEYRTKNLCIYILQNVSIYATLEDMMYENFTEKEQRDIFFCSVPFHKISHLLPPCLQNEEGYLECLNHIKNISLRNIPMKTRKICLSFIKKDIWNIKYVPFEILKGEDILEIWNLVENNNLYTNISMDFIISKKEDVYQAIKFNPENIKSFPKDIKIIDFWISIFKKYPKIVHIVPKEILETKQFNDSILQYAEKNLYYYHGLNNFLNLLNETKKIEVISHLVSKNSSNLFRFQDEIAISFLPHHHMEPLQEGGCPICIDDYKNRIYLHCTHSFCFPCLKQWCSSKGNASCPICRSPIHIKLKENKDLILK